MGRRFWRLTPLEFGQIVKGYDRRQYNEWFRAAWMVCYFTAPFMKKAMNPSELVGKPPHRRRTTTIEE